MVGLALGSPGIAREADELAENWVIEKAQWSVDLESTGTIEVRNGFGDLRVRPSEDGWVHMSAVIQRHVEDPLRAEIGHSEDGPNMNIEVDYSGPAAPAPETEAKSWERRRVDLTLFIPIEAELVAETERGLIEVKGLKQPIEARSEWGNIVLVTSGPTVAYSERGTIDVHFGGTDWSSVARLETLTGVISVSLPADSDVAVEMETKGQMTTDFSLEVAHHPDSAVKTGKAAIGEATAELYLRSDRGNLSLRRLAR